MKSHRFGRMLAASVLAGGMSAAWFAAQPASASTTVHVHGANAAGIIFDFGDPGIDQNFSLVPPFFGNDAYVPFAIPPGSCPFDPDFAQFVMTGGNADLHNTSNNNGDWGGGTADGPAILLPLGPGSVTTYTGHLTLHEDNGQNAAGQAEIGETFTFNGMSNGSPAQPLTVKIHWHGTQSATGNLTSVTSSLTCS